ncbi:MAG: FtsX-like permease family protein [Candidatus Nitrohelix vancouverensis]|uniref:FtsX-like permease family protein n=1 Tax=Candidatus Nitrohelix vancouverensis TaxID=2705534 RepID=A0A7T0C458_9BACT|nr:MAG: FtsX-like permease family protein [Candidatus Nitrohelix vancouverensis]
MIFKLAWMQFCRQGVRAWLSVCVTGLTLIALIFLTSLLNGFQKQATKNLTITDVGGGHYRQASFDILSPTDWEDRTFKVPSKLEGLADKAEVLVLQGQLFPNRRLYPVQLRGIAMEQTLLDLPLDALKYAKPQIEDVVPVIIGARMSDKTKLAKGDSAVLRWRDRFGTVDARDAVILEVVDLLNPRVDEGVVWLRLDHLRSMTQRRDEVSWVAVADSVGDVEGVDFVSPEGLMSDLINLIQQDRRNSRVLWLILLFLVGVSVFNSQILNVFKRQVEIGTMMAFGMEAPIIVALFTMEGVFSGLGAFVFALCIGVPFFAWFQSVGLDVSHLSASTMPVQERVYLDIHFDETVLTGFILLLVIVFAAWKPVQRIASMSPTQALRGKGV